MSKFTRFPSIEQFRNVVQGLKLHLTFKGLDDAGDPIYDEDMVLPVIKFEGTVKLHGTNSGIVSKDDEIWFQSRTSVISPAKDNAGFSTFFSSTERLEKIKTIMSDVRARYNIPTSHTIALFGEWCGGNIQKGVALNELGKRFVLFGIKHVITEESPVWLSVNGFKDHSMEFYNIRDYGTYHLDLDLNDPEKASDVFLKLTDDVEKECPFAKAFDVSGIGEGIVWVAQVGINQHMFKTKGEKHAIVKKKKDRSPLDIEKVNSIKEFIEYAVTENRLEQGIEQVFTSNGEVPTVKGTGLFIKWVSGDVAKEEIDTLVENGLTMKEVGGELSKTAKNWFFAYLDKAILG